MVSFSAELDRSNVVDIDLDSTEFKSNAHRYMALRELQKVSMLHSFLRLPRGVRLERSQIFGLALYHALALLAFVPWFFSWTGVVLAVLGIYVFGVLGINLGYHRLLTHKGFVCPKWLEHGFAVLGVCCLQGSPSRWVATHRRHHEHADDEPDPHSPIMGFLWAHIGWVLVKNETMES